MSYIWTCLTLQVGLLVGRLDNANEPSVAVGVRQHLSRYLERVKAGEDLVVTDGVALLPVDEAFVQQLVSERLVASGPPRCMRISLEPCILLS